MSGLRELILSSTISSQINLFYEAGEPYYGSLPPQTIPSGRKSVLLTFWNSEGCSIHCKTEHVNQPASRVPCRRNFYQYHINTPVRGPGGGARYGALLRFTSEPLSAKSSRKCAAGICTPFRPHSAQLPPLRDIDPPPPPLPPVDLNFFHRFPRSSAFCKVL